MWAITGEPWSLPVTLAAGVLVDADHAPDLWWTFALGRKPIATTLLHGWEWVATLLVVGILMGFPWWLLAMSVGHGLHVVTDQLFNGGGWRAYSVSYRASHGFQMVNVSPDWDSEHAYGVLQKEMPNAARLIGWWKEGSFLPTGDSIRKSNSER